MLSVTVCVGEWSGRHWSSVAYIHWRQVSSSLSVKVDVDVSVISDCVCRWVKWTSVVKCCLHSLTSSVLVTVSQSRCRCECCQWLCVGEWSGRHWSSVVYIHWCQVTLSLSVKVDVDVSVVSDCVCRWVKWMSLVECCLHSLTSSVLVTVSQSRCRCECCQWLCV